MCRVHHKANLKSECFCIWIDTCKWQCSKKPEERVCLVSVFPFTRDGLCDQICHSLDNPGTSSDSSFQWFLVPLCFVDSVLQSCSGFFLLSFLFCNVAFLPDCWDGSGLELALLFRESWDPFWGGVFSVACGATDRVGESGLFELEQFCVFVFGVLFVLFFNA